MELFQKFILYLLIKDSQLIWMIHNPNKMSPIVWWQYLPVSGQPNNSDDTTVHNAVKCSHLCSTYQHLVHPILSILQCFVSFKISIPFQCNYD